MNRRGGEGTGLARFTFVSPAVLCCFLAAAGQEKDYRGKPFHDSVYHGGAQKIPGRVQCAYYDLGGEGVAYHDTDAINHGSGVLNPADGTYLNQFRMNEGVDTSYAKFHRDILTDDSPYNLVLPPENQLYVGWTEPGEWFKITVKVARAGTYTMDLLYTSNRGGTISLDLDGEKLTGPLEIVSTKNDADPVAWRQWHHWKVTKDMAVGSLPKGKHVLTVRILTNGNMNLAYFDFKERKGAAPGGSSEK
ncbi:MAG: carbohydrate-binding protein [Terriglobia bacterium]